MNGWDAPTIEGNDYGIAPGDIFYSSWGYDQTNVDYYQVVRVTARKAEILPIGSRLDEGTNRVVAHPAYVREYDVILRIERGDAKRTKLCAIRNGYKGEPSIVLHGAHHHYAWRWDGRPLHDTIAAGEPGH